MTANAPAANDHDDLIAGQFGAAAEAYLASPVHARGADLDQMAAIVGARPAARALDLGCGGGHVAFTLAPLVAEVTAYDLSADMLAVVAGEAARRGLGNVATRRGNVEALPFADAAFDVVVSRYSAHHWRDLGRALAEARRVAKPGATAVFMDIVAPDSPLADTWLQAIELLRDPSHVRDYSVAEWHRAATAAGFAPGTTTVRRLRLDFASWVARMRTPEVQVQAIRALQSRMPPDLREHFAVEADGSFTLDTMLLEARAG